MTGPIFNSDNTTLFVSIQHPGEGGTMEDPLSSWPNGDDVPCPTVLAIRALDGRPIGS